MPTYDDQPQLPFEFFGQRVIETAFALAGTIQHPEAQPPRVFVHPGERVVFLVVAYADGWASRPVDAEQHTLQWTNRLRLAEAYEVDAETMAPAIESARAQVRAQLAHQSGEAPS